MTNYTLNFFGEIDTNSIEGYYIAKIEIDGCEISIDLNFNKETVDIESFELVQNYLNNVKELKEIAEKAIWDDYKSGREVKEYINFHLEELSESVLVEILKDQNKKESLENQLLSLLRLNRIGFYLDEDTSFVVIDHELGADFSIYLLVVYINRNKEVENITIES